MSSLMPSSCYWLYILICGTLSNQKNDNVTCDDEVGATLSVLNYSYNMLLGNMLLTLKYPILPHIDETGLSFNEEMLNISLLSWLVIIHIPMALIHEVKFMLYAGTYVRPDAYVNAFNILYYN